MSKGLTWPGYKGEARQFAGVPGVYGPGIVIPLKAIGMTEQEAREAIQGTPLELVDTTKKKEGD